jgi:hypothetical protein
MGLRETAVGQGLLLILTLTVRLLPEGSSPKATKAGSGHQALLKSLRA